MTRIHVKDLRVDHRTLDLVERTVAPRAGYGVVTYRGCAYRVQKPNGHTFIDLSEPIRCRGEVWAKPTGRARRELCAEFKRKYKFTRRMRRREAAWWLSRARWLRCSWRKEVIRR